MRAERRRRDDVRSPAGVNTKKKKRRSDRRATSAEGASIALFGITANSQNRRFLHILGPEKAKKEKRKKKGKMLQVRSACCRGVAPAKSAEGASIAGRGPQARGCSITRRGERKKKKKEKKKGGRRAAPAASAEGASIAGRAPQARGCSITRRTLQKQKSLF